MKHEKGFSLVELVVTLVIIGVIVSVAAPRLFTRAPFQASAVSQEVASALRYAQKTAIASRCRVQASINRNVTDSGGTQHVVYALHYLDCVASPPQRVQRPQPKGGNSDYVETDAQGVSLTGSAQIVFDGQGVPQGLASPATIQIGGKQLTIEPGSGLVHVQ